MRHSPLLGEVCEPAYAPTLARRGSPTPPNRLTAGLPALEKADDGYGRPVGRAIGGVGDPRRTGFFEERLTSIDHASERGASLELVKPPDQRDSDATAAIFVLSYFRAFVIDSISSDYNSFHGKRRCVEAESGSKSWPMEVPPDRSRNHESTKTRRNPERELHVCWQSQASGKRRFLGMDPRGAPRRGGARTDRKPRVVQFPSLYLTRLAHGFRR